MWKNVKQYLWNWRGVWIATPLVASIVLVIRGLGFLQLGELLVYDQFLRWRSPEPRDDRIVIVGIDDSDIEKIGQVIIPDRVYAQLIARLKAMQPRGIGLDIYRDLPVEPGHQELVQVFSTTPELVGIQKVIGKSRWETVAPPPALAAKNQVGVNDLVPDRDQKIRRAFLSINTPETGTLPSFAMYLAALYLEPEGLSIQVAKSSDWWQIGDVIFQPFERNDGSYVNADAGDYQILLNYRGSNHHFETVSLSDVLEGRVPDDWASDRLVLIGFVSEASKDVLATPYTLQPSQRMAGIEIHANITSQILSAVLNQRPLIQTWPEYWESGWIILWALIGAMLAWVKRDKNHATTATLSWLKIASIISTAAALIGIAYLAFLNSWWIPIVPPLLALGGSTIAITGYIARTAGEIRNTFGRYLSNEIVATLLESPEGLALGGERRQITLLTSDLRGFTATSERLPPEEVVKILNFYLGRMADVITQYQGTIDEFMGDGILVLFGAPISREDDAQRSVACAIAMQLAMKSINQQMKEWGLPALEMGIGINTGEVVVGNIGSEKRTKYGVVGAQVNLTYRIESYTTGGQVLISETTLNQAKSIVKTIGQKEVMPKGVKRLITIHEVGSIEGKYNLVLPQEKENFFTLNETIPIRYNILEGKHISQKFWPGCFVQLSEKGAKIRIENDDSQALPASLTNIKLNLLDHHSNGEASEDVYAKVLDTPRDSHYFVIRFTAKPPLVAAKLNSIYKLIKLMAKKQKPENMT